MESFILAGEKILAANQSLPIDLVCLLFAKQTEDIICKFVFEQYPPMRYVDIVFLLKIGLFSVLIGSITYWYPLTHFSLSVDSELPMTRDFSMALGRWGANLFRIHVFEWLFPRFTLAVGLLFWSMAITLSVALFRLRGRSAFGYAALLATFPQMAYHFVFNMQADYVPLGILFSVIACALFVRGEASPTKHSSIALFVIAVLLTAFSIACYQAVVFAGIMCFLIRLFGKTYDAGFDRRREMREVIRFALLIALSASLYAGSVKWLCPPIENSYLVSYVSGDGSNRILDFLKVWGENLIGNVFYGSRVMILVVLAAFYLLYSFHKEKNHAWIRTSILVALLLIPFVISFFITNGYHPARLYVGAGFVVAFLLVFVSKKIPPKLAGAGIAIICLAQVASVTHLFYIRKNSYDRDIQRARSISLALSSLNGFDREKDRLYFYGCIPPEKNAPWRLRHSEIFEGSHFTWDNGSNFRIVNFFTAVGLPSYQLINDYSSLAKGDSLATKMPAFPEKGFIRKNGTVVVVKLGNTKGAPLPFEH